MQDKHADSAMPSGWQPTVSGNARLTLSSVGAGRSSALRMDFAFQPGGGFVVARLPMSRPMPNPYAVRFRLRGRGAASDLELKLTDASGENVWRYVKKDLPMPARWKRMLVESRDVDFAWGPSSGSAITQLGALEFAIVARSAGEGTLWIADLVIEDLSPAQSPTAHASSALADFSAAAALNGPGWTPHPDDRRPWIVIDLISARAFGGLIIDWLKEAPASGFRISGSMSGLRWRRLYAAASAGGKRSYVYLPGLKSRLLRLQLEEPTAGAALRPQSFEFSRSIEDFWYRVAAGEARGWHPRWLHREQSVWTPIGISDGTQCALMNADGMVEVGQGTFCIEPMLGLQGRLITWADVSARQELLQGWMPVPSVIWESVQWRLRVQAEATVTGALRLRYRFENLTNEGLAARLFLVLRPFQVTPPWQKFGKLGGVSRVHDLAWREGAVRVDESTLIVPSSDPAPFAAMRFDEGFMASRLLAGTPPRIGAIHDPFGFATGVLEFPLSLDARGLAERIVTCMPQAAARSLGEAAFDWGKRFAVDQWTGSGWLGEATRAALTASAHVLVTRCGPALQPGPRRYTRSWIRDGAMMSAALLRMGHTQEVREFIRWYAPHQRADGFVPCCVDREGVDWLVEHDSHGELIALIADYHRFTADDALLSESWGFIDKAVGCIEGLLDSTGLLPISASHEGYLAQPVHSYWDDFWALRGLRDAVGLARALGHTDLAERWERLSARFATALFASIENTRAQRNLDFIPGSIEWADFDPTATANAIYLLDVPDGLNRAATLRTFDKYLADWRAKRRGEVAWANYTPYEIRNIGALVRLGRRDAALELLRFFLSDRRPRPWNQWPEIAWRDSLAPAHIGDLPHTWIGAEYVLALRSLFAYEREADRSLVLAAGLAPEWIEGAGVCVKAMPTAYGSLSYSLRRLDARSVQFDIGGGVTARLVLRPPLSAPLRSVLVDGKACASDDDHGVTIPHGAAQVICTAF